MRPEKNKPFPTLYDYDNLPNHIYPIGWTESKQQIYTCRIHGKLIIEGEIGLAHDLDENCLVRSEEHFIDIDRLKHPNSTIRGEHKMICCKALKYFIHSDECEPTLKTSVFKEVDGFYGDFDMLVIAGCDADFQDFEVNFCPFCGSSITIENVKNEKDRK